jgi:enoyl-CoA hydratase/carnithine racemase
MTLRAPAVHFDVSDNIATVTLDDASRKNALSEALGDAFAEAIAQVRTDQRVRAVVVQGAGDSFSAGGDLGMLERLRLVSFDEAREHMLGFYARYLSLLDLEVPVVAAVSGPAIGAGLCVACACDVIIAGRLSPMAFNFTSLGLHPGMGATFFVPRRVGPERAAALLFSGRRFDGEEAARLGLVAEAVDDDDVLARARVVAMSFAQQGPQTVRALKRSLAVDRAALAQALAREATEQAHSYGGDELGEGLAAAREKRAPRF